MDALTIGEVARRAGVATSAIRYYESIGLLAPPSRVSGQRRYSAEILERLSVIQNARGLGLSIDEIRILLFDLPLKVPPRQRWRKVAQSKLPELEDLLHKIAALKHQLELGAQCNCDEIEQCFMEGCTGDALSKPQSSDL